MTTGKLNAVPEASPAEGAKRKMHRSPNYPGLSLVDAIVRAKQIYDAEKRALAGTNTLLAHMGYKPNVGPGLRALSALKQYGLLEERSGQFRISDAAFNILNLSDASPDRQAALKEAAIKPALFSQILEAFKDGIPSDLNLRDYLIRDHSFNPSSVQTFIKSFRESMELANLPQKRDDTSQGDAPQEDERMDSPTSASSGSPSGSLSRASIKGLQTVFNVRMKDGTQVELRADKPLSQKSHGANLKALLDMLLPEEQPASGGTEGDGQPGN